MWTYNICKRIIKTITPRPIKVGRSHRDLLECLAKHFKMTAEEFYNSNPLVVLYGPPVGSTQTSYPLLTAVEYNNFRDDYMEGGWRKYEPLPPVSSAKMAPVATQRPRMLVTKLHIAGGELDAAQALLKLHYRG
jgi:hypothetical protein